MLGYKLTKKEKDEDKKEKKKGLIVSKRTLGLILMSASSLAFVALFSGLIGFLKSFLLGVFGYFAYALFIVIFFIGLACLNNRKYVNSPLYILYLVGGVVSLLSIIDLAIYHDFSGSFASYLSNSYKTKMSSGGILIGFFTAILRYTIFEAGAFVVYAIIFILSVAFIIDYYRYAKKSSVYVSPVANSTDCSENVNLPAFKEKEIKQEKVEVCSVANSKNQELSDSEIYARQLLGLDKGYSLKSDNILNPLPPIFNKNNCQEKNESRTVLGTSSQPDLPKIDSETIERLKGDLPISQMPKKILHDDVININRSFSCQEQGTRQTPDFAIYGNQDNVSPINEEVANGGLLEKNYNISTHNLPQNLTQQDCSISNFSFGKETRSETESLEVKKRKDFVKINFDNDSQHSKNEYITPTASLFTTESVNPSVEFDQDINRNCEIIENVLNSFKIPAKVIGTTIGPALTRYEIEMPLGISVKKVIQYQYDIKSALETDKEIRIEAPIPGKNAVGIEVPNKKIAMVGIKDVIFSREFLYGKSKLPLALGKDINGDIKLCDLTSMPHLLIAGTTNSGKSVCLNALIISLIQKFSPDDLKLLLIDPKHVEFAMYNGLPHLVMPKVVTDKEKAVNSLLWAVDEMERRYLLLEQFNCRNFTEYITSDYVENGQAEKLPYIIIVIDELADLMMVAKREVEDCLVRLAQKARAAGIHIVVATQRPSVDVVTGLIKANFPSRITFALASFADSKTIIDQSGAEKLLGNGDMFYKPIGTSDLTRIQGCFTSRNEVESYINYIIENNPNFDFDISIEEKINNMRKNNNQSEYHGSKTENMYDDVFKQALKFVIENGQASISIIQRKLQVGYPRAARIIDQMEEAGYISSADGSKPRSIYITMEEWEEIFGE